MTEASRVAQSILRDPGNMQWYLIPFLAFVIYVYAVEAERRNWSVFLAGLAFYGLEWTIEIGNALILHFTGHSALWTAPGSTSFLLLIGLNIEISMMFAVAGVIFTKTLPADRNLKILGIPNRWLLGSLFAAFCVFVEVLLNQAGMLLWEYSWWNVSNPFFIWLIGYMPYMVISAWVHDMESVRRKVAVVLTLYGVDVVLLVIFAGVLGWI